MTIAQFIAALLLSASYELAPPECWRHVRARRDLARALRGVG